MINTQRNISSYIIMILTTLLGALSTYIFIEYNAFKESEIQKIEKEKNYIEKQLNEFYIPLKNDLLESKRKWKEHQVKYLNTNVYEDLSQGIDNSSTFQWKISMMNIFNL